MTRTVNGTGQFPPGSGLRAAAAPAAAESRARPKTKIVAAARRIFDVRRQFILADRDRDKTRAARAEPESKLLLFSGVLTPLKFSERGVTVRNQVRPFAFTNLPADWRFFFKLFGLCASVSKTLASRQSILKVGARSNWPAAGAKDALLVTTQITNFKQCSENQP